MKALAIVVVLGGAVLNSNLAKGEEILIRGATVHTAASIGTLDSGDVLVRDGKIAAVGHGLIASARATIIEAKNLHLTPGLFGGISTIGLLEVGSESSASDAGLGFGAPAWQQQWRPEFDVTLAYNPRSIVVPVARIEGLTWIVLTPRSGDSILAGRGAAITLDGRFDAVIDGSRSLFVTFGSDGSSNSGGSRAAQFMLLQQAMNEAVSKNPPGPGALLHMEGREALAPFLFGGRTVFEVERAADIHQILVFARRHRLHPIISGGAEAWVVAQELAREDVPVILNPLQNLPNSFDQIGSRLDNAAVLHRAGVRIAFSSGETQNARKIRQLAGNAVAHGLPWDVALAAITATPADIFGVAASHGRIAVGQSADLVLWTADPLEVTTLADRVWIAGQPIAMSSRQSELRDRYLERLKPTQAR